MMVIMMMMVIININIIIVFVNFFSLSREFINHNSEDFCYKISYVPFLKTCKVDNSRVFCIASKVNSLDYNVFTQN